MAWLTVASGLQWASGNTREKGAALFPAGSVLDRVGAKPFVEKILLTTLCALQRRKQGHKPIAFFFYRSVLSESETFN